MVAFLRRASWVILLIAVVLGLGACESDYSKSGGDADVQKAKRDELKQEADATIALYKNKDPGLEKFFKGAYGYAVFPDVGKGGIGVGGAYGKGVVYAQGRVVAYSTVSEGTIGLQLGGQTYREILFFQNKESFERFMSGNFEFAAQASAVAAERGAATNADYAEGVAIFTLPRAGLMGEAVVGGQKFTIETH